MTLGIMIISCVKRFNAQQSDNHNFAIKGSTVKQFLDSINIDVITTNKIMFLNFGSSNEL